MFAHCCGHATIVAPGQPLIMKGYGVAAGGSLAVIRAANPATRIPQVANKNTYARLALGEMIAATCRSSRVRIHVVQLRDHPQQAECHRMSRATNVMPCRDDAGGESPIPFFNCTHRSFRARTSCGIESKKPNATAADINRDERDRVIFVQPALFAPAFVSFRHAKRWLQHTRSTRGSSFIFMTEQRRAHFVAVSLRAVGMQKSH